MKHFFKRILLSLFFVTFISCGAGTQVLSPPNPSEGPTTMSLTVGTYLVHASLPPHWTFQRLEPHQTVPESSFDDTDPNTTLEAVLTRDQTRISLFSALLDTTIPIEQALGRFVQAQHPGTTFQVERDTENSVPAFMAFIQGINTPNEVVIDGYYGVQGLVLWFHFDFRGSSDEILQTVNELQTVVDTLNISHNPGFVENEAIDNLLIGLCSAVQRCDSTLNALRCSEALETTVGNEIWDQLGTTWSPNSVSTNEVRQRVNAGTVLIQQSAYDSCLNELGLLCTDSFRVSAGADYSHVEDLFSSVHTPSCSGVLRN